MQFERGGGGRRREITILINNIESLSRSQEKADDIRDKNVQSCLSYLGTIHELPDVLSTGVTHRMCAANYIFTATNFYRTIIILIVNESMIWHVILNQC